MYLSQLRLDCINRFTMRTLSDVYRLHQFIMSGFYEYEHPGRVLFRVEPETKDHFSIVLVQSFKEPHWNQTASLLAWQTKKISFKFQKRSKFRFRLRANPVITRNGKRLGLIRDDALVGWLRKKEEQIGVWFCSVLAVDEGYTNGIKNNGEYPKHIKIKTARFEGCMEIIEPERFHNALVNGIGPAKAFGCGLLSLARA